MPIHGTTDYALDTEDSEYSRDYRHRLDKTCPRCWTLYKKVTPITDLAKMCGPCRNEITTMTRNQFARWKQLASQKKETEDG